MKIIIADTVINLDACEVLDIHTPTHTHGEHWLRNGVMPLFKFATFEAAVDAIESIQAGVRRNQRWIEIDAVSGRLIDCRA